MQDKVFPSHLALKCVRSSSTCVWSAELDHSEPDHTSCITKSCEISTLLRYCTALSGNSLPTFRDYLLVQSSRVKKSKRTEHDWSWHYLLFWGLCPSSNFLKKYNVSDAGSVFFYRQKRTYSGGPLWLCYSQSTDARETVTCEDMHLRTDLVQGQ
jgi:hypothetical protein